MYSGRLISPAMQETTMTPIACTVRFEHLHQWPGSPGLFPSYLPAGPLLPQQFPPSLHTFQSHTYDTIGETTGGLRSQRIVIKCHFFNLHSIDQR